jgi:hypothetical protein
VWHWAFNALCGVGVDHLAELYPKFTQRKSAKIRE